MRPLAHNRRRLPHGSSPVEVVSGPIGRQRVHFQGLAASLVPHEMDAFLEWFNRPSDTDPLTAAALTRLRLVTIHPFDDGNGRIARAVSDMCLARSGGTRQRFHSISAQVHRERNAYCPVLEQTQRDGTGVTTWISGFLGCLEQAIPQRPTHP